MNSKILIFIDDDPAPLTNVSAPVNLQLDTRKLVDGAHKLRIVSQDPAGVEGIREINFQVRNGPAIIVEGIGEGETVDGILPLMINAYSKGDQKTFLIDGVESPQSVPVWVWITIISFVAWSIFYTVSYLSSN
jgi:hypothetical protein